MAASFVLGLSRDELSVFPQPATYSNFLDKHRGRGYGPFRGPSTDGTPNRTQSNVLQSKPSGSYLTE